MTLNATPLWNALGLPIAQPVVTGPGVFTHRIEHIQVPESLPAPKPAPHSVPKGFGDDVLRVLRKCGPCRIPQIAWRLCHSDDYVRRRLHRLADAGLVQRYVSNGNVMWEVV